MKRTTALGLVAVVFVVGLAAGVLGARLLGDRTDGGRNIDSPPFQRYFTHRNLGLSDEQQRRMDEIFADQREKFQAVHRNLRPEVEALMDETQAEIEAVLTPEQLERFRARRNRWHRRGRHLEGHRRPGRHRRNGDPPPPPESPPPSNPDGID